MANLDAGIAKRRKCRATTPAHAPLNPAASRLALQGALSVALLIGAAQTAQAHDAPGTIHDAFRQDEVSHAVQQAEAAVVEAPQDATLRASLGHAYLRAGRFESAATALDEALALGNSGEHIRLSLALAQIACGQNRAALATLDHAVAIAPADLGLALALAGDPDNGIAVLTGTLRDGPPSPNLRQNLAYAYALAGRWADATVTAGFDLPPDRVNGRLQQWAQTMQSGGERARIARLLNVPLVEDQGMPPSLALNQPLSRAVAAPMAIPAIEVASDTAAAVATIAPLVLPIATAPQAASARQLAVRAQGPARNAEHFVQLAAYHNLRDAERGKTLLSKRHPLLRGHGLLITESRIHGRSYWQVVMAGFDGASASSMCSSLKRQGAACFAYAGKPARQNALLAIAP